MTHQEFEPTVTCTYKEYAKLLMVMEIREMIDSTLKSKILRLLNTIYHALIEEETWNFIKDNNNHLYQIFL